MQNVYRKANFMLDFVAFYITNHFGDVSWIHMDDAAASFRILLFLIFFNYIHTKTDVRIFCFIKIKLKKKHHDRTYFDC